MKNKSKRKIIQIACRRYSLYALCDDSTIWVFTDAKWKQVPEIPEEKESKDETS